jgi:putative mRNA 3-end processing factor
MKDKPLLRFTDSGIYCEKGNFYIDPWKPVDRAVITHAHSDHARWGSRHYLAHSLSRRILQHRLGADISLEVLDYGQAIYIQGVSVSLHPAGHIPGSAQVRVSHQGDTWVVSGDYKIEDDGFIAPFEAIRCNAFVTESTFGLPVYQWASQQIVFDQLNAWWKKNSAAGITSLVFAYALGKAQRLINGLDTSIGPIYTHGAVGNVNEALADDGFNIQPTTTVTPDTPKEAWQGGLVVAPPSAQGTPWMRKFKPYETAMASGWMMLRGTRRRRNTDRGFTLSDHADWNGLLAAIDATGAESVYVTHGYTDTFARYLREVKGLDAQPVRTSFVGESLTETEEET